MSKRKRSGYCEHSSNCDLDHDCYGGDHCRFFTHTRSFSSIKEDKPLGLDYEREMDLIWEGIV